MKPLKLFFFFFFLSATAVAQSPAVIRQYIDTYKDIAMAEMQRTGVPAAITLAQGIHETGAGQSQLVKKSNNHFGIKCKTGWQGESVTHDDDLLGECFRKYADPADSYKDHSDFLKDRKHYAFLFTLDPMDYEGWAYGLKKAGYATNPKYPQILIKLIDNYGLQDYTLIALGKKEPVSSEVWASTTTNEKENDKNKPTTAVAPQVVYPQGVFRINETEVVFVPKGMSYLAVAEAHNISLARLFDFNDLPQAESATTDGLIFLHRKRKRGAHEFYTVTGNETLHQIAQAEGLRLESLLEYNFLESYMQPAIGSTLYLQGKAPAAPRLAPPKHVIAASVFNTVADGELSSQDDYIVHTVQPKETVYGLSKKYAVTATDILKWNNLESPYLKTGQQLRINKGERMSLIKVHDRSFDVYLSEQTIQAKVAELAMQISREYADKRPLFIAVLNGAFMFAADLFRHLTIDAEICFIKLVSYKGMRSSGHVTTAIGLDQDLYNRHVVIVEDIVDTGKTLGIFLPKLLHQQPASLEIAALLHKPEATKHALDLQYVGFSIPNKFVVGYGLDYDGLGRNLKEIYQVVDGE